MLAREEILADYRDNIMRLEANAKRWVCLSAFLFVSWLWRSHTAAQLYNLYFCHKHRTSRLLMLCRIDAQMLRCMHLIP